MLKHPKNTALTINLRVNLESGKKIDIIAFERMIHITNSPSHHMIATLFKAINESKIAIIGIKKIFRNKNVVCVIPARIR